MSQELQTCIAAQPTTVTSVDGNSNHSSPVCLSQAKQQEFAATCDHQVQEYCSSFSLLPNVNPPSGCPGHQESVTEDDRPPTNAPNNAHFTQSQSHQSQTPSSSAGPSLQAAQNDLATCQQSAQTAESCCGDPASCGGVDASQTQSNLASQAQAAAQNGDQQGLNSICAQAAQAGSDSANSGNSFAGVCMTKHSACENICQQLYSKWSAQAQNCSGGSCGQLNSIISQLGQSQSSCASLQSTESSYRQLALSSANQSGIGSYCSQVSRNQVAQNNNGQPASQNPNGNNLQPGSSNLQNSLSVAGTTGDPYSASNISQTLHCDANSGLPSCGGGSNPSGDAINEGSGSGPMGVAGRSMSRSFASQDLAANDSQKGLFPSANQQRIAGTNQINGGRGGFADSGSARGSGADPRAAKKQGRNSSSGFDTDVLHGEGARTGFEGYGSHNNRSIASARMPDGISQDSESQDSWAKWKGFSLLSCIMDGWRGKKSGPSAVGLQQTGKKRNGNEVGQGRLGRDEDVYLDTEEPSNSKPKTLKFIALACTGIGMATILGAILFFALRKKPIAVDRRKKERRESERRVQPTTPREPALERRRPETMDRRQLEQRVAQRRVSEAADRRSQDPDNEITVIVREPDLERRLSEKRGRRVSDLIGSGKITVVKGRRRFS